MNKIISIFIFISAVSTLANTQSDSPSDLCKLIDRDARLAVQCLNLTSGKNQFQPSALDLCKDLYEDQSKVLCLNVIANKSFKEGAVKACNTAQTDPEVIQCLKVTAGRDFNGNAIKLCGRLPYTPNKLICAQITANQTFQNEAVKFCSDLDSLTAFAAFVGDLTYDLRNNCLKVIANRTFTERELSICNNLYHHQDRVECLRYLPNVK